MTFKNALLLSLLATLLTFSCSSEFHKEKNIPFLGEYRVNRYIHKKNNLRVLIVEDDSSPTFAYQTWFKVGSRNEERGKTGLAHLLEHMLFKETANLKAGEFERLMDEAGAEDQNAFTSRDITAYVQALPKERLELITRLEAERMLNLKIDQKAFKTETEVVLNERRYRNENSPEGLLVQHLFETAFLKHSYHWPVIGYQKDLNQMKAEDLIQFYKNFYQPSNATIVIVGDVKASNALDLVEKYYGKMDLKKPVQNPIEQEPPQKKQRRKNVKVSVQVPRLIMGFKIPGILDPVNPTIEMIQAILTDGQSSRLTRKLVDSGIATGVYSGSYGSVDPTLYIFFVTLQKGRKAGEAEKVIFSELQKLMKTAVSEEEFKRARSTVKFNFYSRITSNSEIANFLGKYETVSGNFQNGVEIFSKIQEVTPEDIMSTAQKFFQPQFSTVITGVQK